MAKQLIIFLVLSFPSICNADFIAVNWHGSAFRIDSTGSAIYLGKTGYDQFNSMTTYEGEYLAANNNGLYSINPNTGEASLYSSFNNPMNISALATNDSGVIYGIERTGYGHILFTYEPLSATKVEIAMITLRSTVVGGIQNIAFGADGKLHAFIREEIGRNSIAGGRATINIETGEVSYNRRHGAVLAPVLQTLTLGADGTLYGIGSEVLGSSYDSLYSLGITWWSTNEDIDYSVLPRPIGEIDVQNAVVSTGIRGFEYINPVPVPTAAWLFASALIGLVGINRLGH